MTTYVALLDGGKREETVEVRAAGPGTLEVRLRGESRLVDVHEPDACTVSLLEDGASRTATIDARGASLRVRLGRSVFPMELVEEKRLRLRRAARRLTVAGRQVVAAPLPGRIAGVHVRLGDAVREGQPLVTLQALGVRNELRSPKDGKVVALDAREGEGVEENHQLCAVE